MTTDRQDLSLADLEAHDPRPSGHGAERRFLCPLPTCADHQRGEHKNLAANVETGAWRCCRCGASGKLTERWEPRERLSSRARARRAFGLSQTATRLATTFANHRREGLVVPERVPTWRRRWDQAVPVAGTPGADYLASRGIPEAIATAADVRYLERWGHWTKDEAGAWALSGTSRRVVFPIIDQAGERIGIQGRKIAADEYGEKMLTNGVAGVFATSGAETLQVEQVAIVEAPIDALSLAVVGVVALSTQGTSWPDWLPRSMAFKTVLLAHDNDEPNAEGECAGDVAAAKLTTELRQWGASVERWRPLLGKDWNADLVDAGADALRDLVSRV